VNGDRRFSQAIAEGDGISVVANVDGPAAARTAEEQGAEALALRAAHEGLADATSLPVLWRPPGRPEEARAAGADACVLAVAVLEEDDGALERLYAAALELGLDCVVEVVDEEELERALESLDPEVFLLSSRAAGSDDPLERVLELLHDVPAGKLAIADLRDLDDETLDELERAGIDAVIVAGDRLDVLAARG